MLSRTSEYALRATIYMAQHLEEQPILGKEIAVETGIPAKYLSKVLGDLVRVGVLTSSRGRGGGFRLVDSPRKLHLHRVLAPFETMAQDRCPFGNALCSDEDPCIAHDQWKKVVGAQQRFLREVTLHDVAVKSRTPARKKKKTARMRKR
ncbi:MAG: Rrf2 family transcriptional regulator [bacterium]|nr:Rrf2 family transcriptional regulator [bacterium]